MIKYFTSESAKRDLVMTSRPRFFLSLFLGGFVLFSLNQPVRAQSAHSNLTNPEQVKVFKKVSSEIMCVCGCNDPLDYCNHTTCIAWGIRDVIDKFIAAGKTEQYIVGGFINGYGDIVDTAPEFAIIRNKYPKYINDFRKGFGEKFRSYPAKHNPQIIIVVLLLIVGGFAGLFLKGKYKKLEVQAASPKSPKEPPADKKDSSGGSSKDKLYRSLYDD